MQEAPATTTATTSTIKHDLHYFDFVRGWAAVLVFFHHAAILGGGPAWLTGDRVGAEAVNAFMFASGFLIHYQCVTSSAYDGLRSRWGMRNFYLRRFFRIAPAYYVTLAAALLLSHWLGEARMAIGEVVPASRTSMERYFIGDYLGNAAMHLSFAFGLLPQYAYSTPLPDWSLGLEMQFYLLFPLFYALLRGRFLGGMLCLLGVFLLARVGLKLAGIEYPMPSLLALKFHNFAAGMVVAHLFTIRASWRDAAPVVVLTLAFLGIGERSLVMPAVLLFSLWFLCSPARHAVFLKAVLARLFAHRSSSLLADLSYSVYIVHLLFMLPVFAVVARHTNGSTPAWVVASVALLALVAAVSWAMYRWVELPGIALGKRLLTRAPARRDDKFAGA